MRRSGVRCLMIPVLVAKFSADREVHRPVEDAGTGGGGHRPQAAASSPAHRIAYPAHRRPGPSYSRPDDPPAGPTPKRPPARSSLGSEAMDILIHLFVGLHIIGIAALLGGFLTQMKAMGDGRARFGPAMLHGALTMLVTGAVLVGLNDAGPHPVNNIKIGLKLAFLVVILALVYVKRDEETVDKASFGVVGALTMTNIFIAVLWT
jgi:hypothetical protein